jgi:two-component system OmpR family sensor kinase
VKLQRRVLRYLALAAIASCALTVAVAVVLVRHRLATQRITALENQANLLAVAGGAPGALTAGDHVYRVGSGRPRRVRPLVAATVLSDIGSTRDADGTITLRGRSDLYVSRATASGRIVLIRGARLEFSEWRPFLISLVLAGIGGALLAALLSIVLARRLTRPIGELAAATRRVASGEPGVKVPVRGEDELAGLGSSFNTMAIELEHARESQRAFLESVSHELKTPLTSIRGYAEALEEEAVSPAEGAPVILAEADRLSRLVFDLLDLARFGRSDFAVERQRLDLGTVATAAVERHRPRATELGVELEVCAEPGALATGDEGRALQATSNLVENALRVTPPGGRVTVSARARSISVLDTGPGLDAADVRRAFDRFYLFHRYRTEREVGSGLGLAIVRELVEAMSGQVEAAGRPGAGAEFTIRLPAASGAPVAPDGRDARGDLRPPRRAGSGAPPPSA